MEFRNIEFNPKFVPNYEVVTRSGSVYQLDTVHDLFIGGQYRTPTKFMNYGTHDQNIPNHAMPRGFHPAAFNPESINPEIGRRLHIIIDEDRTLSTSPIASIREIPLEDLFQNKACLVVQTDSGSRYEIDLEHKLIRGGSLSKTVPFTEIGSSMGRTRDGCHLIDYERGNQSIDSGRCLSVFIPGQGWLNTSCVASTQYIQSHSATPPKLNYESENFNYDYS